MSVSAKLWGEARPRLIAILPVALGLLTVGLLVADFRLYAANRTIRELKTGHDVAVEISADTALLSARIEFLLSHDRIDEVQPLIETLDKTGSDQIKAAAHYNFANGRLRQAFDLLTRSKLDAAGPFVVLARQEYRRALTADPEDWDAKFNLDVASRLIRDFPAFERTTGDTLDADRKKIWTDIPGTPRGLP